MIVDANVITSASLGQSRALVMSLVAEDGLLLIPDAQMREARLVTADKAGSRDLDFDAAFGWTDSALLPIQRELYEPYEQEARARLQPAGQKDWPLVALALATGHQVWSNDYDLFGTGVVVWNTHNIGRALRRGDPREEPTHG